MVNILYGGDKVPVIDYIPDIQVCHHPDSEHIVAGPTKEKLWRSFGNVTMHEAAILFVKRISLELVYGDPIRVLIRDGNNLRIPEHDAYVDVSIKYTVRPTFPERNALDYQDAKDGRERD